MRHYPLLLSLALLLGLMSCQKEDTPSSPTNTTLTAQTLLNVAYGAGTGQNMDVYLPAARTTTGTKVLVMIHGGAWVAGDKSDFAAFVDTMKRRLPSYAIFNINYRLSANPINIFPTQENDVKAALDFIKSKAATYIISDTYVLIGASAGAHLALLQSYKYSTPIKPKAVVSFFGPTDMADMYNNPVNGQIIVAAGVANAVGATPTQNPAIYASSSPVNFVSGTCPPTLFLHGGIDPLVSASQSTRLQTLLTAAGVANDLVLYPNGGHGDWDAATYADAFNHVQQFLQTYVP